MIAGDKPTCEDESVFNAGVFHESVIHALLTSRRSSLLPCHHGIFTFSQRVNVPVGPCGTSSATHPTSREPSSTEAVPSYPLRFVLVKPGVTKLTLIPVDSSSIIMASVIALRAVLDARYTGLNIAW